MGELERILQLEKENKDLKEEKKTVEDIAFDLTRGLELFGYEIETLKESRDELLAFLNQCKRIIGKHLIKKQCSTISGGMNLMKLSEKLRH